MRIPAPPRRPPLLIALQTEATVFMSQAIGQAGLAAAFLTGQKSYKPIHELNAYVMSAVAVVMVITAVCYRRSGGPRWVAPAAVVLLAVLIVQATLGRLDIAALHIFSGVLFVVMATLFTSYAFWFGAPVAGSVPAGVPGPGEAEQPEARDPERQHGQQHRTER